MSVNSGKYQNLDVVWLAADTADHLAAFVTGGEGPIPLAALPAVEDSETDALSLPEVCEHRLLVTYPRPEDFIALARRGLYVYDWSNVHRTRAEQLAGYELVAVPSAPLQLREAIQGVRASAELVRFPGAVFGSAQVLEVEAHGS